MEKLTPDFHTEPMLWTAAQYLRDLGVQTSTLTQMTQVVTVNGNIDTDGRFQPSQTGETHLAFCEERSEDVVFWNMTSNRVGSLRGRVFALGEENATSASTYAFDCYLFIHASALDLLVDSGRGIVVLRWDLAFDLLRDVPRIAIAEALLPTYQRAMRPGRLPELAVLASKWRAAA